MGLWVSAGKANSEAYPAQAASGILAKRTPIRDESRLEPADELLVIPAPVAIQRANRSQPVAWQKADASEE